MLLDQGFEGVRDLRPWPVPHPATHADDVDPTTESLAPAVIETHTGLVFFVGDRAYKLKRPVQFAFVDLRSREARAAVCHREVELNRRLAPDVYLGVADITGPDGALCDHLVVMRRLPEERRLSSLVARGVDVGSDLDAIADRLAQFHQSAETSPAIAAVASAAALGRRWEENHAEMTPFMGSVVDPEVATRVIELARRYLAGRTPLFDRRIHEGRARDGHGDLLSDDIFCLDDGPRILDCLEYADDLRWGDTLADVAFLAMDLERIGHPEFAHRFLERYRTVSGDDWPASLAHHHIAYRAQVRSKVACLRAMQGDGSARAAAPALLSLAERHLDAARVRLVLVGGLPGSGKSTLARDLGPAIGAVVLSSDEIRKRRAGLVPHERASAAPGEGIYDEATTAATYRALLTEASTALANGHSVVLDASWHDQRWRDRARSLAREVVADLGELRCSAPQPLLEQRVRARTETGRDPSDADVAVLMHMASRDDPWPEAATVDTTDGIGDVLARARAALGS